MQHYTYLIVGGGMAADAAARGIREHDTTGTIAIIGADADEPYTRPALSKKLWTDPGFSREDNFLNTAADTGAEVHTGTSATEIDPAAGTVTTSAGTLAFDRLLLATGGEPRTIDLEPGERVIYFRTFADYRRLRGLAGGHRRIAVVGGGFIGTELAAALVQNDTETTLFFDGGTLEEEVFPPRLATHFHDMYAQHGVELVGGTTITGGHSEGDTVVLADQDGHTRTFDAVVVGLGIDPATGPAAAAGIYVDDGIVVDEHLRTSHPNVYAAGDVARYPDRILGRQRVEHVDNAKQMGAAAGRIMAGSTEEYTHTPYFYSNVFEFGYRALGTLDCRLQTVEDWADPCERGVVYYLDDARQVRGVLLVGLDGGLDEAREVLSEPGAVEPAELVGRIPAGRF
jgi:3-phenylpropionate/trans-cinnamate dioxygenase ferredoxin reductase subunit